MLSGSNTYTGNTTILSGVLQLGNGGAERCVSPSSTILLTGGTLGFDNTAGLTQGTNFSSGEISGSGSLLVSAGMVTMNNAANSFTGNIVVNGGTLNAATSSTAGTAGGASVLGLFSSSYSTRSITVNTGGTLYFSANGIQGGEASPYGPVITINGGTFYNNDQHNYLVTSPLTLNSGTLTASDGDNYGNPSLNIYLTNAAVNVSGNSLINGSNGANAFPGLALAKTTTFNFTSPGTLTVGTTLWNYAGNVTANLIEAGTGLMVLTASNQYNGTTTISSGGTLQLGNGGTTGSLATSSIANNGTLVLDNAGAWRKQRP